MAPGNGRKRIKIGKKLGEKNGIKIGEKSGEDRFGRLYISLLADGRAEEMERAAVDADYRLSLYRQYCL